MEFTRSTTLVVTVPTPSGFRLVSYRDERGSILITTNKSVKDLPGVLAGEKAMATAILDRILHHGITISIRGDSYRLELVAVR